MNPFYSTDERIAALRYAAGQWFNTPFHDHAQIKGVGVDCVHLAAALYQESGFMGQFQPPQYSMSEGQHAVRSKVLDWLDASRDFAAVPNLDPRRLIAGDLLCFQVNRVGVEHHVGVYLGGDEELFLNSMQRYGVRLLSVATPQWRKMLTVAYRPIERP